MKKNELLTMLTAGFKRFYSEGYSRWSKEKVLAAINPIGEKHSLEEVDVQAVLKQIESTGLIRLIYEDNCYLEVLHD